MKDSNLMMSRLEFLETLLEWDDSLQSNQGGLCTC